MENYIALEKIFKEIKKLDKIIALIQWNYNTEYDSINMKVKAEELILALRIKNEMLADSMISDLIEGIDVNQLSHEQQCLLSLLTQQHESAKNIGIDIVSDIALTSMKCQKSWHLASQKNDFKLLEPELEKLISLVKKKLSLEGHDGGSNYDTLLKPWNVNTDYVDSICKKIGTILKDKKIECLEYNNVDFELLAGLIEEFISKVGGGKIKFSLGLHSEVYSALDGIKVVIGASAFDPIFDFLYSVGKALYLCHFLKTESLNSMIVNPVSLEAHGYLFSRILLSSELGQGKIKKAFRNVDVSNQILNSTSCTKMNFDFMYAVVNYSIEKLLINNEVSVKDLPSLWQEKMQYYLNIKPEQSNLMLLQPKSWYFNKFGHCVQIILSTVLSSQSFSNFSSKEHKIVKNRYYHPLKDLEKIFDRIINTKDDFMPLMEKLDTHYYFDYT